MSNITCPIAQAAKQNPEAIALETAEKNWTYTELNLAISHYQEHHLQQTPPHTVITINATPTSSTIIHFMACLRQQAISFMHNPMDHKTTISPTCLITQDSKKTMKQPSSKTQNMPQLHTHQWATLISTSGSSGQPKHVLHNLNNHLESALASATIIPLDNTHKWALTLPLYHISGIAILFRCFLAQATVVIPPKKQALKTLITTHNVTHLSLVNTQLEQLLANTTQAPPSLKALLVGGGPVSQNAIEKGLHQDYPLYMTYGLTELSSQVCTKQCKNLDHLNYLPPLPGYTCRISPNNTLLVKGPGLYIGYLKDNHLSLKLSVDGWFNTNDRASQLPNGDICINGRGDRMFISGGENIHPEEIEQALLSLPFISQAAVINIPDNTYGQRPAAFILSSKRITSESLKKDLRHRLLNFKIPKVLFPWPTDMGLKPNYKQLNVLARQQLNLDKASNNPLHSEESVLSSS